MGSGLFNDKLVIAYDMDLAVEDAGYLVKLSTTAGDVSLTAASTDVPCGYTFRSSYEAASAAYVAQAHIGVVALVPGTEAELQCGCLTPMAVGDWVCPSSTPGTVVYAGPAATLPRNCFVVGQALATHVVASGTVKVRIMPFYMLKAE